MIRKFRILLKAMPVIASLAIIGAALLYYGVFDGVKEQDIPKRTGYVSEGYESPGLNGPVSYYGERGFPETVEQIMERGKSLPLDNIPLQKKGIEGKLQDPDRRNLPQHPDAKNESTYPPLSPEERKKLETPADNPQTVGSNFTGISLGEAGYVPADNMAAAGPTQIIFIANGRIKTFNKTTGTADGVLNTTTDNFFNSVRNGSGTSDPRVRYDRLTQRWFIVIINVTFPGPNRILIAMSNASTITLSTVWTFYFVTASAGQFLDYPTLGLDNNALYIGTNNFGSSGGFTRCDGYLINKASLISGSALVYLFVGLVPNTSSDGPYTPQGVDNYDVAATEGYFIGVSFQFFSSLVIRRVSNPGGVPSISPNISITVNTTTFPISVPHLGMIGTRTLDALDDRLFAACIRNGRLWTAHNIQVNSSGIGSNSGGRTGSRWYEITNLSTTPALYQSGTIFDPAASNPLSYWIPAVSVSGQGHAAFIYSSAGSNSRINVATSGRLAGGALGTTQAVTTATASSTSYNVQTVSPQRWGDYSYVSVDPNDNMTMWGVAGFCNSSNSWGENITKLLAPPPPPLTSANPNSLNPGVPSVNVIITGTPTSLGEGFYDPGAGFTNRISASINGGVTVNSTTYNSNTQVTLNISTVGATVGTKTVTITNPDGQSSSSSTIFDVPLPVALSSFNYSIDKRDVTLNWVTTMELNNSGFDVERKNETGEWKKIGFISGHGTTNQPQQYLYKDLKLETGKYNYRIKQIDFNGTFERYYLNDNVLIGVPGVSEMSQNYPNPFNPKTKIDYHIASEGNVSIKIYDLAGREVRSLVNEQKKAGYYTAEFDAGDLASGVYFYKMVSADLVQVKKMLVVK